MEVLAASFGVGKEGNMAVNVCGKEDDSPSALRHLQALHTTFNDKVQGIHNKGDGIHDYFMSRINFYYNKIGLGPDVTLRNIPNVIKQLIWEGSS
jgi:hypothetical protein